jgi:hypothetical protein
MTQLTEKKLVLILIAVCLGIFLYGNFISKFERVEESGEALLSAAGTRPNSQEKVIYLCRLGDEEIPSVQISEVTDATDQTTDVVARVNAGSEIEVTAAGAAAVWDYKAIAARSGESVIEILYAPGREHEDYEWVLTLADKNTFFKERVRDCTEVSDE